MDCLYCKLPAKMILHLTILWGCLLFVCGWQTVPIKSWLHQKLYLEVASQFLKIDGLVCITDIRKMEKKIWELMSVNAQRGEEKLFAGIRNILITFTLLLT